MQTENRSKPMARDREERPSKRSRRDEEYDDEDERPARRRGARDDDEDERPRRRGQDSLMFWLLLGGGGLLVVVLAVAIVVIATERREMQVRIGFGAGYSIQVPANYRLKTLNGAPKLGGTWSAVYPTDRRFGPECTVEIAPLPDDKLAPFKKGLSARVTQDAEEACKEYGLVNTQMEPAEPGRLADGKFVRIYFQGTHPTHGKVSGFYYRGVGGIDVITAYCFSPERFTPAQLKVLETSVLSLKNGTNRSTVK
jgi:hypothetical protein